MNMRKFTNYHIYYDSVKTVLSYYNIEMINKFALS